nr:MDR family MFS transporter [Corynebacterium lactis]
MSTNTSAVKKEQSIPADWSRLHDKNTPVLFGLMLGNALIAMDSTILATAVPSVVDDLGDFSRFPWLFSIYLLAQAVTVPVYGKLADMFGRRPIIMFGVTLFMASSVMAGLSGSMTTLIIARALQGIGAGAVGPMAMTILGDLYTLAQRGRVQGYMASVWAIASVLGPTLGGFFAELGAWRWIFFINVPFGLVALFLIWRNFRDVVDTTHRRVDYLGASVLTVGLTALILGILEGGQAWSWLSWQSAASFGIGIVALAALRWIEPRAAEPVVAFELLNKRLIRATSLTMFSIGALTVGVTSFAPTYLQTATGISPIIAGLAVAAMTLGWPLTGSQSSKLYMPYGFRRTIIVGSLITLTGSIALAITGPFPNALLLAVVVFVMGLGLGLSTAPSTIAAQNSVPLNQRGQVTAINTLARSAGSAIGVAVFGALSNAVLSQYSDGAAGAGAATDAGASPAAITVATTVVFIGVAVGAALMVFGATRVPDDRPARVSPAGPLSDVGPDAHGPSAAQSTQRPQSPAQPAARAAGAGAQSRR